MGLGICEGCRRFARGETCPFCGARVGAPKATPAGRRTRAGRLVTAAALVAGCSSSPTPAYGAPAYGDPAYDAGPMDASKDAGPDGPSAAYGGPPSDGGDAG